MLRRWIIAGFAVAGLLVVSVFVLFYVFWVPRMTGHINEQFLAESAKFRIRVTAYAENGGFVAGAYYVFESTPTGTEGWTRITTFRHDDPVPIPRNQVRFVSEDIAYVFMGWVYAVTTDAGRSWSVWQATTDLPRWQCCNYRLVQDVVLRDDGSGTMTLHTIPQRSGEVPRLETTDFGVHWHANAPNQAMERTPKAFGVADLVSR